jgi:drug/metabolite transporter (DMT)-like permease
MSSQHFATILIIGIFAWSIFRRVRRNIGRQKLRPRRAATSIIILSAISVLIVGTSLQNINLPLGFAAGLLPGALLGFLGCASRGLKRTPPAVSTRPTRTSASRFQFCSSGASPTGS